jgi:hypothetical protein
VVVPEERSHAAPPRRAKRRAEIKTGKVRIDRAEAARGTGQGYYGAWQRAWLTAGTVFAR